MAEWKDNTRAGFILFVALAVPLLLLVSCIPTLYHICSKMKRNYKVGAIQTNKITEGPREAADDQFFDRSPLTNSLGNEPPHQQRNMMLNINQTQLSNSLAATHDSSRGRLVSSQTGNQQLSSAVDTSGAVGGNYLPPTLPPTALYGGAGSRRPSQNPNMHRLNESSDAGS